jgi:hypothetical protein
MAQNAINYEVTNIGGTINIDPTILPFPDFIGLYTDATFSLTNDLIVGWDSQPADGTVIEIGLKLSTVDLNSYNVSLFGYFVSAAQLLSDYCIYKFVVYNGLTYYNESIPQIASTVDGQVLIDGSVDLDKLGGLTSAQVIVGNGSGVPTAVTQTGDVTISNTGVTAIGSAKVTNTMLAGSIARTKILAGSANHVIINDGSGNLSSAAQLTPALGGTGIDNSSATGFLKYSAGTASVGTISGTLYVGVIFGAGDRPFKIRVNFAGTITGIYACVSGTIGTGDGVITPKNNAGTTMTDGEITFTSGDVIGTAETSTPTANNTFVAGDVLTFAASGSDGGNAQICIDYTRTA